LDYAFSNVGQQVGLLSHVFSLKVDLKKWIAYEKKLL
jgi:hypothetical protein